MGKNKKTRQTIAGLRKRIVEHEMKIEQEQAKVKPDEGYIQHWQKEIAGWNEQIRKLRRRLPGSRKKGS